VSQSPRPVPRRRAGRTEAQPAGRNPYSCVSTKHSGSVRSPRSQAAARWVAGGSRTGEGPSGSSVGRGRTSHRRRIAPLVGQQLDHRAGDPRGSCTHPSHPSSTTPPISFTPAPGAVRAGSGAPRARAPRVRGARARSHSPHRIAASVDSEDENLLAFWPPGQHGDHGERSSPRGSDREERRRSRRAPTWVGARTTSGSSAHRGRNVPAPGATWVSPAPRRRARR
jgi:hypothetical protein